MAIKRAVGFSLNGIGDGSSSSWEFILAGAPVFFVAPDANSSPQTTFDLLSLKPSDVANVTSPTGSMPEITGASITTLGTKLSLTFASAVPDNLFFQISGTFIF